MILNGKEYKLLYLDTNALRAIIDNEKGAGKGFFEKFFSGQNYAACFAFANVQEIRPYNDIYQRFLDFFSMFPCLMFNPHRQLIQEEYKAYRANHLMELNNNVMQGFTPIKKGDEYNFRKFIDSVSSHLSEILNGEKAELSTVVLEWEKNRKDNQKDFDRFGITDDKQKEELFLACEIDTIIKDLSVEKINVSNKRDYCFFPSLRMVEFSLFQRQHLTKKPFTINDVMDVRMSSFIPYVDAVITEGFQANIYKKAKNHIPEVRNLEIYTLRDIRNKE